MWQYESSKRFPIYHPENELIFCHQLESVLASKSNIRSKVTTPKRHIYTPWGICVCNMKTIKQMLSEISSGNWTYNPPSIIKSIIASKSKVKIRSKVKTPERHIYTPWGICVCSMKTIQQTLSEISSGNWSYHPQSIDVNNRLKIKGQKLGQRSYPPKGTSTPPKRCVYAIWKQSANSFRDIVRKRNTDAQTHGQTWWWQYPPPLLRGRGIKTTIVALSDVRVKIKRPFSKMADKKKLVGMICY